jgi:methylsterol monooxygenase
MLYASIIPLTNAFIIYQLYPIIPKEYLGADLVFLSFTILFWILGTSYMILDKTPYVNNKVNKVENKTEKEIIPQVIINNVLFGIYFNIYDSLSGRGLNKIEIPTLGELTFELLFYSICYEVVFYYGHRLLHHKWIYKYIHKKHHTTFANIGITALYMHPIDAFVEITMPFAVGLYLLDGHLMSALIFIVNGTIISVQSHSGYFSVFFPENRNHYLHHTKYNYNYGLGLLDWLHGTNY